MRDKPRTHIRQGLLFDTQTFCGAEGSTTDWLNWGQLPGSPKLFPRLCMSCWMIRRQQKAA